MAKQQGSQGGAGGSGRPPVVAPVTDPVTEPEAEAQKPIDLLSGRYLIDAGTGIYVGIRMDAKAQRKLKAFAFIHGVKMQDLIAAAVSEVFGDVVR